MYLQNKWPLAISLFIALAIVFELGASQTAQAQRVNIEPDIPYVDITISGEKIRIERNQNTKNRLTNGFSKTSRACPPFCIHPMKAAAGVETVGEIEVIRFLKTRVEAKTGLLIDARLSSFYKNGTIPGSVNIPFNLFSVTDNPYHERILAVLGAVKKSSQVAGLGAVKKSSQTWDFSKAMRLVLFCNGPWCDQSSLAIKNLISSGYPAERISYYRGGMQNWQALGFNVSKP